MYKQRWRAKDCRRIHGQVHEISTTSPRVCKQAVVKSHHKYRPIYVLPSRGNRYVSRFGPPGSAVTKIVGSQTWKGDFEEMSKVRKRHGKERKAELSMDDGVHWLLER